MSVDTQKRPATGSTSDDRPPFVVERVRSCARCHACGDGVVDAVCSHCARLLCKSHTLAAGPLGLRAVLELFRAEAADADGARTTGTTSTKSDRTSTATAPDPGDRTGAVAVVAYPPHYMKPGSVAARSGVAGLGIAMIDWFHRHERPVER